MRPALGLALLLAASGCLVTEPAPEPMPTQREVLECGGKDYPGATVNVTIVTSKGEIGAILYSARSPITVCNMLLYFADDYYDNTIWHRICSHVIQAGGLDAQDKSKAPRAAIKNEAPTNQLRNYQRTLGMARDVEPDSAQAHFYVNLKDNLYLDYDGQYAPGYAVFGNVTRGWEVVQQIAQTPVQPTPPRLQDPLAPPGCNGKPVPTQETTIRDIVIET